MHKVTALLCSVLLTAPFSAQAQTSSQSEINLTAERYKNTFIAETITTHCPGFLDGDERIVGFHTHSDDKKTLKALNAPNSKAWEDTTSAAIRAGACPTVTRSAPGKKAKQTVRQLTDIAFLIWLHADVSYCGDGKDPESLADMARVKSQAGKVRDRLKKQYDPIYYETLSAEAKRIIQTDHVEQDCKNIFLATEIKNKPYGHLFYDHALRTRPSR